MNPSADNRSENMVHKKSLFKPNFVVVARNVSTGQIVELPISTREEYKRMKWYPQNDYVPLKVKKGGE